MGPMKPWDAFFAKNGHFGGVCAIQKFPLICFYNKVRAFFFFLIFLVLLLLYIVQKVIITIKRKLDLSQIECKTKLGTLLRAQVIVSQTIRGYRLEFCFQAPPRFTL